MSNAAMKLAIDVLNKVYDNVSFYADVKQCIKTLEEALAKQTCEMGEMCLQCPDAQPKQDQDMPKIGCVNHDCDKCKEKNT
jgi:hypothetical protein